MNNALKNTLTLDEIKFENFFKDATKYLPDFKLEGNLKESNLHIIVCLKEGFDEAVSEFDKKYQTSINKSLQALDFKPKAGEVFSTLTMREDIKKVCFFICSNLSSYDSREVQGMGAKVSNMVNSSTNHSISLEFKIKENTVNFITDFCYGLALRNYRFDRYFSLKKEEKGAKLKNVLVITSESNLENNLKEALEVAKHNMLVRDLVNCPHIDINPSTYSKMISEGFGELPVKVKILEEEEMRDLGMNALLAVGHGGVNRPRTVIMEYLGNPSSKEIDYAIVGKGVCFDSGGYSLKPAGSMEDMKCDMAGSAVSFASIRLIAKMGLKVNIVSTVGLVENLVSSVAYKPGDVLKSMSGQTIEVLNTDAEGRLVLADVLFYTQKFYKPKYMIDLATLTGAVTVALGDVYAGIMYNDEDIVSKLEKSSLETGELIWRLPFRKEFDEMINSSIADVKNTGSARGGGTVTAGQFLKRFVNFEKENICKWAHLDIAGVAFDGKGGADPKVAKGGTGFGVNLLYKMIKTN